MDMINSFWLLVYEYVPPPQLFMLFMPNACKVQMAYAAYNKIQNTNDFFK